MQEARSYYTPVLFINKNIFNNKIVFAVKITVGKSLVGNKEIYKNDYNTYDAWHSNCLRLQELNNNFLNCSNLRKQKKIIDIIVS